MLPVFRPLVVIAAPPFYCCWWRHLHNGDHKYCPFFGRWCRRYGAYFTAVGAAFYATASVNAARFSTVFVGGMLPFLLLLVPPFTLRRG